MSNSDLTIIINTFKSEEQIHSCLDSIGHEFKILIIENSKNNEFKTTIEKKYPNVTCKLTGENLGYGKGNNFGLKSTNTDYALILRHRRTCLRKQNCTIVLVILLEYFFCCKKHILTTNAILPFCTTIDHICRLNHPKVVHHPGFTARCVHGRKG